MGKATYMYVYMTCVCSEQRRVRLTVVLTTTCSNVHHSSRAAAATYPVLNVEISSPSDQNLQCIDMAFLSCLDQSSVPPLYSDKVSLGESELQ